MKLCRVECSVVSTIKHETYEGLTLFVVDPIGIDGNPTGDTFLAVDRVQSGPGDTVLVMQEGNGVRQLFGQKVLPIRSIIVGIVDDVNIDAG